MVGAEKEAGKNEPVYITIIVEQKGLTLNDAVEIMNQLPRGTKVKSQILEREK